MSSARERQARRKKRQEATTQRSNRQQVVSTEGRRLRPPRDHREKRPPIKIPGGRYLLLLPAAIILMGLVIFGLASFKPESGSDSLNALWLHRGISYTEQSPDDLNTLSTTLKDHRIGTLFVFISSMKVDGTWSGKLDGRNRLSEVEESLRTLSKALHEIRPDLELYGWIEVQATTPEGYRLDSEQVQRTVADLSRTIIDDYDYDGVLLDVKPVFDGNEDFLRLLRTVHDSIGLETPLAVVVSPDLTPTDADITLPQQIAPGTIWSEDYKKRVIIQADTLVVTAYNSYLSDPLDYIKWVSYQVQAFVTAPGNIETTGAFLIISVPDYNTKSDAHDPQIESLAGALDGVRRGYKDLPETLQPRLQGVAIFSETLPDDAGWQIYREKWQN